MSISNVHRLIVHIVSIGAIPKGEGFVAAVEFLSDGTALGAAAKKAQADAARYIASVRAAADPNPWRDATDEAIAGEILRGIKARYG